MGEQMSVYESPQQIEARKKLERKTNLYGGAIVFLFICILVTEAVDICINLMNLQKDTVNIVVEPEEGEQE
jgi:hypothetical protein